MNTRTNQLLQQAAAALDRGEPGAAREPLRTVLAQHPNQPQALQLLALLLRQSGDSAQAIEVMERAARARDDDPTAWNNLGNLRREAGDLNAAIVAYQRALELAPAHASALYNLATIQLGRGEARAAASALKRLTELEPGEPQPWNLLGVACSDAGLPDAAIGALRRAVALAPQWPEAHHNLGIALAYSGQGDEAQVEFARAVEIDPSFARAWESIVRSRRLGEADRPIVARMSEIRAGVGDDEEAAIQLDFALGKALDDLGDSARAFAHYRSGNAAIRRTLRHDPQAQSQRRQAIARVFDPAFLAARAGWGVASTGVVFVVGMPRSGTTLVEQILAAHRRVRGAGETALIPRAVAAIERETGRPFPECALSLGRGRSGEIARELEARYRTLAGEASIVVDKLPGNFLHLGLIATLLPDSVLVHCRRDPLDTCLSIYFQRFAHGHEYAYDLAEIGATYRGYEQLMRHWQAVLGDRLLEVQYEAMVSDPQAGARRLLAHAGLDWEAAMIERVGSGAVVKTASVWQVRRPISGGAVARSQRYAQYLGPLRQALSAG